MIKFDYEEQPAKPIVKIVELSDGVYYSVFTNEYDEKTYRRIEIKGDTVNWIAVKNEESVKSITYEESYLDIPYYIENCFIPDKKGYSIISAFEFGAKLDSVKNFFSHTV